MSVRERPWMKFYPSDWRAEPRLRNCGLLARGLWMEMLALMHESDRYGHLLVNGKPPTDRQLAVQAGATVDEVTSALAELENEGVFSRDRNGTIYSRRMIRDEKRAENARKVGKKGGNPNLGKQKANSAQDNGADKRTVNGGDKPHMPEARVQKEKASPKRALPDDWEVQPFGEGTQSRVIVDGWSDDELTRQLERFKAHHRKEGSKFADWQAAWSTWVLNSVRFAQSRPNGGSQQRDVMDVIEDDLRRQGKLPQAASG